MEYFTRKETCSIKKGIKGNDSLEDKRKKTKKRRGDKELKDINYGNGSGRALSRLEIMGYVRDIFDEEWLGYKKEKGLEEGIFWNDWLKRYGVVAGGLYFEEKMEDKRHRPSHGILIGIRGRGRVGKKGRNGRHWRRRVKLVRRRIVCLDEKLTQLYLDERKVKAGLEPSIIAELNEEKLRKLEILVRGITAGSELYIGYLDGTRFLIEKKRWIEDKSIESGRVDFRIKYLIRWEHIGELAMWRPEKCRFIKGYIQKKKEEGELS